MQAFLDILLVSGKKGFELAFFVLMPIMVFMMAMMRVLDQKGVLRLVAVRRGDDDGFGAASGQGLGHLGSSHECRAGQGAESGGGHEVAAGKSLFHVQPLRGS